jgi:hypothetical protein
MHRIQFIELHEQPWVPSFLRHYVTDALQFGFNLFNVYAPVAPLLKRALDSTGSRSIVDLGSGAGGPWVELSQRLQASQGDQQPALQICLTDRYPNLAAFENVRIASENCISFCPESVDATKVSSQLKGFRTMFTSFHHFLPDAARAILQNAVDSGEGIAIFEITRRAPGTVALTFGFVLALSVATAWIRPFRWSRLLWTYLIPIVPFLLLFDGVVSCLRSYSPREVREVIEKLTASEYRWEIGELPTRYSPITYLIGLPRRAAER